MYLAIGCCVKRVTFMSFSACTSPRHVQGAFNTPDCGHCVPLVRGYSLVYLFEAPRLSAYTHRMYSLMYTHYRT